MGGIPDPGLLTLLCILHHTLYAYESTSCRVCILESRTIILRARKYITLEEYTTRIITYAYNTS